MMKGRTILALVCCAATSVAAQSRPAYEVASIKVNRSGITGSSIGSGPSGFRAQNATLRELIREAYDVQDVQVIGGPGWVGLDRYDVLAKVEGNTTGEARGQMLQALLAERFNLVVRNEPRDLEVYRLVVARKDGRLGPGLRLSACESEPPPCGNSQSSNGELNARGISLARLGIVLTRSLKQVTIDSTGLTGKYDMTLKFAPDTALDADRPSIFTALQEQLGLKLERGRAPVPVITIVSVDHPTED